VCPKWIPSLLRVRLKLCSYLASRLTLSPNRPKRASIWPTSPRSSIGCTQNDFQDYGMFIPKLFPSLVHVRRSCLKNSIISKRTKMSFYLTHVTLEFHRVLPKSFPCPWYIRHKLCTYLPPRLTLSPNKLEQPSTWTTSPRSSIGCAQNDFWAYCTFSANRAPMLRQDYHYLQTDQNELPIDPHHIGVPLGGSKIIPEPMVRLVQTVHLSCLKNSIISKQTETSFYLTHFT
jgi:hypothetical protein